MKCRQAPKFAGDRAGRLDFPSDRLAGGRDGAIGGRWQPCGATANKFC